MPKRRPTRSTSPANSLNQPTISMSAVVAIVLGLIALSAVWLIVKLKRELIQLHTEKTALVEKLTTSPSPTTQKAYLEETLNGFANYLRSGAVAVPEDANLTLYDDASLRWISDDNWTILVRPAETIELVRPSAYKELTDSQSFTSRLVAEVASYLDNRGFTRSARNSSKTPGDTTFYDYQQAWQKGQERCLLRVNPDQSFSQDSTGKMIPFPHITLTCSLGTFQTSYDSQLPYLKALNNRRAVIVVSKSAPTAAKVFVSYSRSGSFALMVKKAGVWQLIYEGQDQPRCSVLKANSFPAEIHSECTAD